MSSGFCPPYGKIGSGMAVDVAQLWMWQVRSMDEAVEWVKRCPNPMPGESDIEIRPVFEMEDFGAVVTPELQAQDERLRTRLEDRARDKA